jgi:CubicO group peptidase (beta-lactamase class C family)
MHPIQVRRGSLDAMTAPSSAARPIAPLVARLLACVLAGLFAIVPASGARGGDEPRDVAADLEKIRALHDVPGLVAVAVRGDRIVAQGVAGVRRRGDAERLALGDRMHLGSCTKAMTATLCALLVAEGKLRWEDRPAETFAKDVRALDAGWKDATLEMLLRNRGGAPENLDAGGAWGRLCAHRGPPRAARAALVEEVLGRPPTSPPGTRYGYSNAGFSVAGAMAERAADAAYEDLLRKRLFDPLGMKSAGFGAPGTRGKIDAPRGHTADGKPVEPGPGSDNPDAIAPAGKVHASLADWARFVTLHLRRGKGGGTAFAKVDFERLHTPPPGAEYAMGWIAAQRPWARGDAKGDTGRVLTHSGSNTMWFAVAWLAPERDFAVLAATNQGGDAAAGACDDASALLLGSLK